MLKKIYQIFSNSIQFRIYVLVFKISIVTLFLHLSPDRFSLMEINRKNVGHILIENYKEKMVITLILHHGSIWSYHSTNYPLRLDCYGPKRCLIILKKINGHLIKGSKIILHLNGSSIEKIDFK